MIPKISILRILSLYYPVVYLCLFDPVHLYLIDLQCFLIAARSPVNYLRIFSVEEKSSWPLSWRPEDHKILSVYCLLLLYKKGSLIPSWKDRQSYISDEVSFHLR